MALRRLFALVVVGCLVFACGGRNQGGGDLDASTGGVTPDACTDLACFIQDCGSKGLPSTSVSGTVYAPNGTLPLYGVTVYVPASDPGPLPDGVQCGQCLTTLLGGSLAQAVTDEAGNFTLNGVPATKDVPLVIQVGKWRRQFKLPNVAACQDTPLVKAETTLPRTKAEGDIPRIAITTGNADALECLIRKLGIADSEFTTDAGDGRVHLYNGNGANQFAAGFPGGSGAFPNATTLWNTTAKLAGYDITLLSCEGQQNPGTKPQEALQAVHDYADAGGRLFMSHWHNIWVGGNQSVPTHSLPDWKTIATFNFAATQPDTVQKAVVDETVPKGMAFATWLQNVGASPTRGELNISAPRYIVQALDPAKAERWVYIDPAKSTPAGRTGIQDFLFTTPIAAAPEERCGKVVLSDMHVSSGSTSKAVTPFPGGCAMTDLSPQEKALAFIFFDISSCIGVLQ